MIGPGLYDLAGEDPHFYEDVTDCPWCGGYHGADDDLCPAMPVEPDDNLLDEREVA